MMLLKRQFMVQRVPAFLVDAVAVHQGLVEYQHVAIGDIDPDQMRLYRFVQFLGAAQARHPVLHLTVDRRRQQVHRLGAEHVDQRHPYHHFERGVARPDVGMDRQQRTVVGRHLDAEIDPPLHAEFVADNGFDGRARQPEIGRPQPGFGVEAADHVHAQAVEVLDADARMHAVEEIQGVVGMRQLEIVGGKLRGAALDPVEPRAVVRRCRDETLVDEAAGKHLLLGFQESDVVAHAKNSRAVEQT